MAELSVSLPHVWRSPHVVLIRWIYSGAARWGLVRIERKIFQSDVWMSPVPCVYYDCRGNPADPGTWFPPSLLCFSPTRSNTLFWCTRNKQVMVRSATVKSEYVMWPGAENLDGFPKGMATWRIISWTLVAEPSTPTLKLFVLLIVLGYFVFLSFFWCLICWLNVNAFDFVMFPLNFHGMKVRFYSCY